MNKSIPVSNLNMGRTLNFSFGGDYRVIFSDATCVVLGEKGVMSVLFAEPNFYPSNIPENLKPQFYDIGMINLSTGNPYNDKLTELPNWLGKMPKLVYLKMENIKISDLSFLKNTEIKRLVIIRSEVENKSAVLEDISKLSTLKYLVVNSLFTPENVTYLLAKLPKLKVLSESEYDSKMDKGEIPVFE